MFSYLLSFLSIVRVEFSVLYRITSSRAINVETEEVNMQTFSMI